jgi:YfiH family protein
VTLVGASGPATPEEADAIVASAGSPAVGIVTADCLPILAATVGGRTVAAIHAGWRGLAAGVIAAGLSRLRELGPPEDPVMAVIGPHIGACCYEVDRPVWTALRARFGAAEVTRALTPTRPAHALLDLGLLARLELERCNVPREQIGVLDGACTCCDAARFHSFRRDGERAGRLVHYIQSNAPSHWPVGNPDGNEELSRGNSIGVDR